MTDRKTRSVVCHGASTAVAKLGQDAKSLLAIGFPERYQRARQAIFPYGKGLSVQSQRQEPIFEASPADDLS